MGEHDSKEHADTERVELAKSVGKLGFFALAFGSMIGVGWVTAMGGWLSSAGPLGASLAFLVGGGLILLIGLCYAEACSMLPVAGGEVAYSYKAFGPAESFTVGTFLAFGYLAVSVFEAISITRVLGFLVPGLEQVPLFSVNAEPVYLTQMLISLVTTGLITWVNYKGVGMAAKLQVVLIVLFGVATIAFIAAGIFGGSLANLEPAFGLSGTPQVELPPGVDASAATSTAFAGFAAVLAQAPFWFVGFDTIPQSAEEANESVDSKTLASLIIISIIGASLFYVLVIMAVGMAGPWTEIVQSDLVAADAFMAAFDSPLLANLVLIAALLGLFTSWNGFFIAGSRVLFALGRGKLTSSALGRTHETHGSPSNAVLFAGAFTFTGACLGYGAMYAFIDVGSFCMSLAFLGVTMSVLKLRRTHPDFERPFRLAGGPVIPVLAALGAVCILGAMCIPGSPALLTWPLEWIILGLVVVLVFVLWMTGSEERNAIDETERAAQILGTYADTKSEP